MFAVSPQQPRQRREAPTGGLGAMVQQLTPSLAPPLPVSLHQMSQTHLLQVQSPPLALLLAACEL